jgi:Flp pilus assembly protein TadG
MKCASDRRCPRDLGRAGTVSLEFALIAIPFFLLTFAAMDLGRFFITWHSLRTLTSELARATLVYCASASYGSSCPLPSSIEQSILQSKTPLLYATSANFASTPTASRSAAVAGVATITASASYNFSFVVPAWTGLTGPISSSATLSVYTN